MAKFIGGFCIVLFLLIIVASVGYYSNNSIHSNFESLMQTEIAIATMASDVESQMLQCRRNEKDFLLRLDKTYYERMQESTKKLKERVEGILKLAAEHKMKDVENQAASILTSADAYLGSFEKIVAAFEIKGLDHTSGLQGKFRESAHTIQNKIVEHQAPCVRVDVASR